MREFFRPFRRKLGVLMLVIACTFAAGWIRSSVKFDGIEVISSNSKYSLSSVRGQIRWFQARADEARVEKPDIRFHSFVPDESFNPKFELRLKRWSFVVNDFVFMTGSESQLFYSDLVQSQGPEVLVNQRIAQIPYWSVVTPLTLLSAWLLLRKPPPKPNHPRPKAAES